MSAQSNHKHQAGPGRSDALARHAVDAFFSEDGPGLDISRSQIRSSLVIKAMLHCVKWKFAVIFI